MTVPSASSASSASPGPESPRLTYAPPPPWHRRRRFRRAVGVVLLLAATVVGWRYTGPAWARGRLLYLQHKCLAYTAPPDQVVYEQDPARAAALLAQPGYANPAAAGSSTEAALTPRCWAEACRLAGGLAPPTSAGGSAAAVLGGAGPSGATLFLHERRTPSGQRRLVAIQTVPGLPVLVGTVPVLVEPGSLTAPPKPHAPTIDADFDLRLPANPTGRRYRYFAGQPDPADPAHFTVRFLADDVPGTVEGWLRDNDRLDLKLRCAGLPDRATDDFAGTLRLTPGSATGLSLQIRAASSTSYDSAMATFSGLGTSTRAVSMTGSVTLSAVNLTAIPKSPTAMGPSSKPAAAAAPATSRSAHAKP